MSPKKAVETVERYVPAHEEERELLDDSRRYYKGIQARPIAIPAGSPSEVRAMALSSRVNIVEIVVDSLVQSMFIDGYRGMRTTDNAPAFDAWRLNGMPSRQTAINRANFQYGVAYATVLPGEPVPVIRPKSPRQMFCLYGDDPDWPMLGLERCDNGLWRLYDEDATYYVRLDKQGEPGEFISSEIHDVGHTPIIRFLSKEDLDDDDEADPGRGIAVAATRGEVPPLKPLQDQADFTTFDLQIAQHYGAFRQRYIVGWSAASETDLLKAAASRVWTFKPDADEMDDGEEPAEIKLGEFGQTELAGYLESREATLRHAATLSQTPAHELTGQLVNLSAEALVAAEKGRDRKIDERQTVSGGAYGRMLALVTRLMGETVDVSAEVRYRDTSARAFATTVDGLGKIATMLEVPVEALWERIPDVTDADISRWKQARERGGSVDQLAEILERQGRTRATDRTDPATA